MEELDFPANPEVKFQVIFFIIVILGKKSRARARKNSENVS